MFFYLTNYTATLGPVDSQHRYACAGCGTDVPALVRTGARAYSAAVFGIGGSQKSANRKVQAMVERLPASTSPDHGTPFYEIFKRAGNDFYKIDRMLFSPAEVVVNNMPSWRVFRAGCLDPAVLKRSFGVEDRGSFYDPVGAIRDVVQNHLLQVLALLTMEPPVNTEGESLRDCLERQGALPPRTAAETARQVEDLLKRWGVGPGPGVPP